MADQDLQLEAADNPEAERPEWLPENFKSPEDLARSYSEAQRKITELAQEKKGLEESVQTLASQFEEFTAQQNRPDLNAVYSQWNEMFENDPISTMAQIAQATAQQVLQSQKQPSAVDQNLPAIVASLADQQLDRQFEDWGHYREKVTELIANDPVYNREDLYANPEVAARTLTTAYQVAKAQDILANATSAEQQQNDSRLMKLNAQSAVGASSRPAPADDWQTRWAEIQNAQSGKLGL